MSNLFRLFQKLIFRLRMEVQPASWVRRIWWQLQGARIGRHTNFPPAFLTWPHQLQMGSRCILEPDIFFKFDGYWKPGPSIIIGDGVFIGRGCEFNIRKSITIGNRALIASGSKFIDHDHGIEPIDQILGGGGIEQPIIVEENVWVGVNAVVLKGVTIGRGAIIGAAPC